MHYKSSGGAAVLSFFITGLGQVYNGQIGKAFLLWAVEGLLFWLILAAPFLWILFVGIWIWGIVDAYRFAQELNLRYEDEERARERRMENSIRKQVEKAVATGGGSTSASARSAKQSTSPISLSAPSTEEGPAIRKSRREAWDDFRKLQDDELSAGQK